jgi:hypothetical protein
VVTVGMPLAPGEPAEPPVARRISFSVLTFWRSRFRRSFSVAVCCWAASMAASLASRSLTWRSFRSRNARWLYHGC